MALVPRRRVVRPADGAAGASWAAVCGPPPSRRRARPAAGPAAGAATALAWVLLACAPPAEGSSLYLAKLCRNFACHQSDRPMMDFDSERGQCVCKEHPCWEDNGQTHHCVTPGFPYIGFHYSEENELVCTCSSIPHYGSVHIAKDLCPGHRCAQPGHPILDWDDEADECVCRSHPCWDDRGEKHECKQPAYPVMRYREEVEDSDEIRPVCECFMNLDKQESMAPGRFQGSAPTSSSSLSAVTFEDDDEYMSPDFYDEDEDEL